jgi:hypothetical protein
VAVSLGLSIGMGRDARGGGAVGVRRAAPSPVAQITPLTTEQAIMLLDKARDRGVVYVVVLLLAQTTSATSTSFAAICSARNRSASSS